jgi:2-keto-3-deoxy-L-rhamnonate aldolase RhmA
VRPNTFKTRVAAGQPVVGPLLSFNSPELVEFCGHLGFDFVLIDAEHNLVSPETCQTLVRAAESVGLIPLVRVPRNDQTTMLPYLETGVMGVLVPHVRTRADAEAAVRAVKYPPRGNRSAAGSSRPANYGLARSPAEYFKAANQETAVLALIEEVEGFENLDDIGSVPDLDLLFFGDGDLAMDMGFPGQRDHPEVQKVVAAARERGLAAGFKLGAPATNAAGTAQLVQNGFCFVLVPLTALFAPPARHLLETARAALEAS